MRDNWTPYLCQVNGHPASITVNRGLAENAPDAAKPWLLWIWVHFHSSRPDGLTTRADAERLWKIEDVLTARLIETCGAVMVGRITTCGRREFYFYGESNERLSEVVPQTLGNFPGHRFESGYRQEPDWGHYFQVLLPSGDELQRIANRDVLDVLLKHGDLASVSRLVRHWIYFASPDQRAQYKAAAHQREFTFEYESDDGPKDAPYVLCLSRVQSVEEDAIHAVVFELCELAEEFGGEYDGWETQVQPQ